MHQRPKSNLPEELPEEPPPKKTKATIKAGLMTMKATWKGPAGGGGLHLFRRWLNVVKGLSSLG